MAFFTPSATRATDNNGAPISDAKWKFYLTGTTTPANVYDGADLATSLGAVVDADSAGKFVPIFLDPDVTYRAVLTDATDTEVFEVDPYDTSGGSGSAMEVGLFTDIATLDIPVGVDAIITSGFNTLGVGGALYYVGSTEDVPADETHVSTNSANGRPVYLPLDRPSLKQVGAKGDNDDEGAQSPTDLECWNELMDNIDAGATIRGTMGVTGGAYRADSSSYNITKFLSMDNDSGFMVRADNSGAEAFSALRINPVSSLGNAGFYATITGYFSGNNLVITGNTAGKILFNGLGLSAPGVAAGTCLAADVLADATGTYAVQVNAENVTQNLGSAGSPLTIKVISNESRGMRIDGGTFFALGGGGGYGIAIGDASDNEVFSMIGTTISNVNISGTDRGLLIEGGLGREHLWTTIFRSTVEGAAISKGSDGIQFRDCIVTGQVYWDLIEGAFHDGMLGGTAVTRDGAADVINGSRMKFHDIQVEQSGVNQQTPFACQFIFRSTNYPNIGTEIIGCNFGGGLFNEVHVAAYNTRGLVFDRNYCNITYTNTGTEEAPVYVQAWDIYLDRDDTDDAESALPYLTSHNYNTAYKGGRDAYDFIIGYYNRWRGQRTRQGMSVYTDVSRCLVVNVPSSPNNTIRMPHRGLWYPAADILTSLHSNLSLHADGCQLLIEHSGRIAAHGGYAIGGNIALGEALFTIPEWMRPYKNAYTTGIAVSILSANDQVVPLRVNASTGVVSAGAAIVAADNNPLRLDAMSWMAVTDPYQAIGP